MQHAMGRFFNREKRMNVNSLFEFKILRRLHPDAELLFLAMGI